MKSPLWQDDQAGQMIYEVRIPKTIIPPIELEEGRVLGFSFILNDNDGPYSNDREGWLELTSGIGYGKSPDRYYDAILWP